MFHIEKHVIGTYFFKHESVKEEIYKKLVWYYAFSESLRVPRKHHFQKNGALSAFSAVLSHYLDQITSVAGWQELVRFMAFPLNELDALWLLLMRLFGANVYRERRHTILELKTQCTPTVVRIDENTLKKVYKTMKCRLCSVLKEGSGNFENSLNGK